MKRFVVVAWLLVAASPARADLFDKPTPREVWRPGEIDGPFASLEDVCRATARERCEPGEPGMDGGPSHVRARGRGAIREARVFAIEDGCHLAVRTAAGWWVTDYVELCRNSGTQRIFMSGKELAIRDVIGGAEKEVYLRFAVDSSHHVDGGIRFEAIVVCGVGASGAPSCTRPMMTRWTRWEWREDPDGDGRDERVTGRGVTTERAWLRHRIRWL